MIPEMGEEAAPQVRVSGQNCTRAGTQKTATRLLRFPINFNACTGCGYRVTGSRDTIHVFLQRLTSCSSQKNCLFCPLEERDALIAVLLLVSVLPVIDSHVATNEINKKQDTDIHVDANSDGEKKGTTGLWIRAIT